MAYRFLCACFHAHWIMNFFGTVKLDFHLMTNRMRFFVGAAHHWIAGSSLVQTLIRLAEMSANNKYAATLNNRKSATLYCYSVEHNVSQIFFFIQKYGRPFIVLGLKSIICHLCQGGLTIKLLKVRLRVYKKYFVLKSHKIAG